MHLLTKLFLVVALTSASALAAPTIHLDSGTFSVTPGGTFSVKILLDDDSGTAGDQPTAAGLLAAAVRVNFPPADANVASIAQIVVNGSLNNDGFGNPPVRAIDAGTAGFDGDVQDTNAPYRGTLLGTITITNTAPQGASYPIGLAFFYPKPGDTRDNFVAGGPNFEVLDPQVTFAGQSIVTVVPEPAGGLIVAGATMFLFRRRRATRSATLGAAETRSPRATRQRSTPSEILPDAPPDC